MLLIGSQPCPKLDAVGFAQGVMDQSSQTPWVLAPIHWIAITALEDLLDSKTISTCQMKSSRSWEGQ